jgi:RNA polymerase sigma factor for flagellar operon FliA
MVDNLKLWKAYQENSDEKIRQKLITAYLPLVKYQAGRVKMMVPEFIEQDDLESFGIIGLLEALDRFDYKRGNKFTTYASPRIRGEIIDHLRNLDWLPHSLRREGKKVQEAVSRMTGELGRKPTGEELSEELGITESRINNIYYKLYSSQWVSLYSELGDESGSYLIDLIRDSQEARPGKSLQKKKIIKLLSQAIDKLNQQERLVVSLYYYEDLTQKEIAGVMELSEARISQLHKRAVYRLRGFLSRKKEQLV